MACRTLPQSWGASAARRYRPHMARLRVVFADDNYLVREGVTALFADLDEIELVAVVADPQSLRKAVS